MEAPLIDTPLMRQYWDIKKNYQDAILLFRLGDFYEMFFSDAQSASKILDIALTSRDKSSQNPVPLCGVPHHSVTGYISKLLDAGHKVAICEQMEDPKEAKGVVRREVVRVVTPGLRTDLEGLSAQDSNPLASLYISKQRIGLATIEVASGSFRVAVLKDALAVEEEIDRLSPRELLLPERLPTKEWDEWLSRVSLAHPEIRLEQMADWAYDEAEKRVGERFGVKTLAGFGVTEPEAIAPAASALLQYVESANRTTLPHLREPEMYGFESMLHLDRATQENLEVFRSRGESDPERSRKRALIGVMDETASAMGFRKLKEWLSFPLRDLSQINERLDGVEELVRESEQREELRKNLAQIYDLERLMARIALTRANARDLVALRFSLERVLSLRSDLDFATSQALVGLRNEMNPHEELLSLLVTALMEEPPIALKEGGLIRDGYNARLDELRKITSGGKRWIAEMESRERERTGIGSLKIGYNRVFGYFIEVTKSNLSRVPSNYHRKQTLSGGERYITPELKEEESKILGAEEKIAALEYELFEELRKRAAASTSSLQELASALSELDVFCSLAKTAAQYRYVRPQFHKGDELRIKCGRHAVVERFLKGEPFVPNDIELNSDDRQIIVLTGPNMAGKSTIMRQVGLISLMGQIGSFVPAEEAELPLVDRLFTRVGASDDLAGGRSTFMVEMSETANILRNATNQSLVLLDEIGRGTSTFDGLSIAWAVTEELHDRIGAKTIFATHYHELTDLGRTRPRVKNMNVGVKEWGDKIVFLRTLADGAVNRSYGIEVARLAGVPHSVLSRAKEILANLEKGELDASGKPNLASGKDQKRDQDQLQLFRRLSDDLWTEFTHIDLDHMTPKEALDILYKWHRHFRPSS